MISEVRAVCSWIIRPGSFVNERWQALEGLPNRSGEVLTGDINLCVGLPIAFTRADIHAGLTHVVLQVCLQHGRLIGPARIQHTAHRRQVENPVREPRVHL